MKIPVPLFALAVLLALAPTGCKRGSPIREGLRDDLKAAAETLGKRIAREIPSGPVLFMNAELSEPLASAMREGLERGLGGKRQLVVLGMADMPPNFPMMTGAAALDEILRTHPGMAAVVTAIGITDAGAAGVPETIPPLYILNWQNPGLYQQILKHPRCRGGLFYSPGTPASTFVEVNGGT
ncbi:MAG: hypothetical protein U1F77_19440 [Kiritimatiellia bacterium]